MQGETEKFIKSNLIIITTGTSSTFRVLQHIFRFLNKDKYLQNMNVMSSLRLWPLRRPFRCVSVLQNGSQPSGLCWWDVNGSDLRCRQLI